MNGMLMLLLSRGLVLTLHASESDLVASQPLCSVTWPKIRPVRHQAVWSVAKLALFLVMMIMTIIAVIVAITILIERAKV